MESIRIENLKFAYPNSDSYVLDGISLTINSGEFVCICGRSGCGKTTLLRQLKPELKPKGKAEGRILFENIDLKDIDNRKSSAEIGFLMQNPENQIVTDKVWHELAFGLESLGINQESIRKRVAEIASFFGIQEWFHKNVAELSGGQKQLLCLASVMVMQPKVIILDEPTGQLDPISAKEFLNAVARICRELGITVIITEHRLEEVFALSDRVIVMEEGKILADGTPNEVGKAIRNRGMFSGFPVAMRVYGSVENQLPPPVTVKEGRAWLEEMSRLGRVNRDYKPKKRTDSRGEVAIEAKNLWFGYEKGRDILRDLTLKVHKGEVYALVGSNGGGKTTALSVICGLLKARQGKIKVFNQDIKKIDNLYEEVFGILPQNPQNLFAKESVRAELTESALSKEERAKEIADLCLLEGLMDRHPYDLSGGEQQRLALGKVLLKGAEILFLDEPTKGMDPEFKETFGEILFKLKERGITIFMVSHDIEFCAEFADRCGMFFDGQIISSGRACEFFKENNFYTTAANRMARGYVPEAVTAEDLITACGGRIEKSRPEKKLPNNLQKPKTEEVKREKTFNRATIMALLIALVTIPVTLFIGKEFFGDRKYYFISILVLTEILIPFLIGLERGATGRLVVISVLVAIGVIGRGAFYMLPQVKPITAVVIIAGVCFGGETGFLVGALSAFVSNFFFGQGPWTPWQMVAFGIVGLLAGIIFNGWCLKKERPGISLYGVIAPIFVYGIIVNVGNAIIAQPYINSKILLASCVAGFPFDVIHGIATGVFLWFGGDAFIRRIDRVKVKYRI